MAERQTHIDDIQVAKGQDAQQATREAAVRHALAQLDPHNDDQYQGYPELLRRLQGAIDVELSRWTSAPVQPPGPSGDVAVAEPARAPYNAPSKG